MAHVNKDGFIEMSEEQRQILNNPLPKNWADSILDKIIWGDDKERAIGKLPNQTQNNN